MGWNWLLWFPWGAAFVVSVYCGTRRLLMLAESLTRWSREEARRWEEEW